MAHVSDLRVGGTSLSAHYASLRDTLVIRMEQRRVYRNTFNELNNLTARDLHDLGITRSNIGAIAREAAYK